MFTIPYIIYSLTKMTKLVKKRKYCYIVNAVIFFVLLVVMSLIEGEHHKLYEYLPTVSMGDKNGQRNVRR